MNKLIALILTALILASSATAKIGDTSDQIIKSAKRDKDAISSHAYTYEGAPALDITYKDGSFIRHLFGSNGKEIAFYLFSAKRLSFDDITKIQKMFHTTWHSEGKADEIFLWLSTNDLAMTARRMEKFDYLCIFDLKWAKEIPGYNKNSSDSQSTILPNKSTGEQDCLIVATTALTKLKGSAYWARIAGFQVTKLKEKIGSHAVVFFQPTETSQVYMYDKSGSMELPTQSHDLTEIIDALNQIVGKIDFNIHDSKWIGDE